MDCTGACKTWVESGQRKAPHKLPTSKHRNSPSFEFANPASEILSCSATVSAKNSTDSTLAIAVKARSRVLIVAHWRSAAGSLKSRPYATRTRDPTMTELRRCSQQLGWLESYENPGKRWRFFLWANLQGRTWPQERLLYRAQCRVACLCTCLKVHHGLRSLESVRDFD